jgi:hypothetical protein
MDEQLQPLTTVQAIQFTLMRRATFNSFDGDLVDQASHAMGSWPPPGRVLEVCWD